MQVRILSDGPDFRMRTANFIHQTFNLKRKKHPVLFRWGLAQLGEHRIYVVLLNNKNKGIIMPIDIKEYMFSSKDERMTHIKLYEKCDERGLKYSYHLTGLLAFTLNTSIPKKGDNAIVCHACNNPKCSNPNHIYWGSYKDNHLDQVDRGTHLSPYERSVLKYGEEQTKNMLSENGKKNKGSTKPKSEEHKKNISTSLSGKKRGKYNKRGLAKLV